ncbi:RNA polymerase sigma factor [Roseinatronobacter sp. S2]|uniref:RNA polymerase sigma factor n=1 Tax=Roseinatronobacter sp. S2 TaxID=3035471 RepID=UPI0024107AAD|nr:RNA polymerase sigma factor [Roseinatronobacter sp. S2]WFE74596.1 RNA polymerase sigma factor [Roseinatronobacter sp. S2]
MVPRDMDAANQDADLLAQFAQGDRLAAQTLTDRLAPRILRFAARMLGDRTEAEDVTQDTMLRLWRIAPEWQDTGIPPAAWLFRIAANLCTDRLRRRRSGPAEMPDLPNDTPGVDAQMMQSKRAAALQSALAALPERQRQAVILRHLEGLSNPDIGAIMMIGVEAVESLTARGKRNLTALLSGQKEILGYEDDH